jgi:hypothetical protein
MQFHFIPKRIRWFADQPATSDYHCFSQAKPDAWMQLLNTLIYRTLRTCTSHTGNVLKNSCGHLMSHVFRSLLAVLAR